jgi:hypothetical protein
VPEQNDREELIKLLDSAVDDGLTFFLGQGRDSDAKVGDWGVWEVLCHMIYWHQATVDGVESIASGGGPHHIKGETDEVNDRIIATMSGRSSHELAEDVRDLQAKLVAAVRKVDDPTSTVFIRKDGSSASTFDRVDQITRHWNGHIAELRPAR